jgi:NADPH:quinone reductase-like Zn-dependent oxidoreductase
MPIICTTREVKHRRWSLVISVGVPTKRLPYMLMFCGLQVGRSFEFPLLWVGEPIVGVFWGSFMEHDPKRGRENIHELITWYTEGKLKPHVSATYPLEHVADVLNDLLNRKVTGKAVLVTGEE